MQQATTSWLRQGEGGPVAGISGRPVPGEGFVDRFAKDGVLMLSPPRRRGLSAQRIEIRRNSIT